MAKKAEKVTDEQLISQINYERSDVRTESYNELSQQRINANFAFVNEDTVRTVPTTGMSGVRFFFTPSVVNTLTMHQSKIFCSDKKTIEFSPSTTDMEASSAAEQLSEICNHILHRENAGFEIITEMFRSAAVNKNAVAKITWDEDKECYEEIFTDLDVVAAQELIKQKETEGYTCTIIDTKTVQEAVKEEQIDPTTGLTSDMIVSPEVKETTIRFERVNGKVKIDVLPPEEFFINEDTTSINNDSLTRFVCHSREVYKSDIKMMFPDVDVDTLSDYDDLDNEYERRARHYFDGTMDHFTSETSGNMGVSKLVLNESWLRIDRDGDGYAEWRHVFTCGSTLLMDEEWFGPLPFASFTFFPVPHKFYGLSVYDRLRSYEETATGLIRAEVDMARLKNTFRIFAKGDSVDQRMLQSGRPGVIPVGKTFTPQDVLPVPAPQGTNATPQIMAELRQQVIADVGIDPISGMVSSKIEESGNDAEKTTMAIDNASVKMEGYSRRFAEGALRDIAWLIASLAVQHRNSRSIMRIVDAVTPGQPFLIADKGLNNILKKSDLISKVGLGHQQGYQKIAASNQVMQLIAGLAQSPSIPVYNVIMEMLKGWGYENPETIVGPLEYWQQKEMETKQMAQQQSQMQQQQLQIEQQKLELEEQFKVEQLQLQRQKNIEELKIKGQESKANIAEKIAKAENITFEQAFKTRVQEFIEWKGIEEVKLEREQGRGVDV